MLEAINKTCFPVSPSMDISEQGIISVSIGIYGKSGKLSDRDHDMTDHDMLHGHI